MIVYLLIFHSVTVAGSILDSEEAELTKIRPLVFNMLVIEHVEISSLPPRSSSRETRAESIFMGNAPYPGRNTENPSRAEL